MMKNRRRGFTLVELLVVMAIMAILAMITFAQFSTARQKARDIQRKADAGSLAKALQMYYADYGYFPPTIGGDVRSDKWSGDFRDAANYIYMKVLPVDNTYNTQYPYCYVPYGGSPNKPGQYAIVTRLENSNDNEIRTLTGRYCELTGDYNYMVVSSNTSVEEFDASQGGEHVAP